MLQLNQSKCNKLCFTIHLSMLYEPVERISLYLGTNNNCVRLSKRKPYLSTKITNPWKCDFHEMMPSSIDETTI